MLNRSKCVVIVPVYRDVEPRCEESLQKLERLGYVVWRKRLGAQIDFIRNRLATAALDEGFSEIMWIDSDIAFPFDAVDHLRDLDLPFIGVGYPKKGENSFAFNYPAPKVVFGDEGEIVEVRYLPTGFLYTKREVYETMIERLKMPLCNTMFGEPQYAFFQGIVVPHEGGHWYVPEDFAFCERARQCGYKILMDNRIRLWHIGGYGYSWEDSCGDRQRYKTFTVTIGSGAPPVPTEPPEPTPGKAE